MSTETLSYKQNSDDPKICNVLRGPAKGAIAQLHDHWQMGWLLLWVNPQMPPCPTELEEITAEIKRRRGEDLPVRIVQVLFTPNTRSQQHELLGLGEDGVLYVARDGKWCEYFNNTTI